MSNDDPMSPRARVDRLATCQLIMVEAAGMLGYSGQDIAAASLFTAAAAFVIAPDKSEADWLEACKDVYRLTKDIIAEKEAARAKADPYSLAEREPQGGVS